MNLAAPVSLGLPVVYLVDDEDAVRDALAWLLRSRRLLSEGFGSAEAFEAMLDAKPAGALADFVLLDMVASVCTGRASIKDAIAVAERQAKRIYR